jgi:hypothetical protein
MVRASTQLPGKRQLDEPHADTLTTAAIAAIRNSPITRSEYAAAIVHFPPIADISSGRHVTRMKRPIPVALLTFVPVLLLALLKPDWLSGTALIIVVMADVMFFRDVSYNLRDLAREGALPYRLRYPFFLFGVGLLGYGAISFNYVSIIAAPFIAVAAAAAIAASKLWISNGPLWPYAATTAAP